MALKLFLKIGQTGFNAADEMFTGGNVCAERGDCIALGEIVRNHKYFTVFH